MKFRGRSCSTNGLGRWTLTPGKGERLAEPIHNICTTSLAVTTVTKLRLKCEFADLLSALSRQHRAQWTDLALRLTFLAIMFSYPVPASRVSRCIPATAD